MYLLWKSFLEKRPPDGLSGSQGFELLLLKVKTKIRVSPGNAGATVRQGVFDVTHRGYH